MTLKRKTYYSLATEILNMVCEYYNVDIVDVNSRSRRTEVTKCRHVYFWLMKQNTGLPLIQIASYVGQGFDHATVLHGIKRVNNMMETEKNEKRNVKHMNMMVKELLEDKVFVIADMDNEILLNHAHKLISKHSKGNAELMLAQGIIYKIMQEEGTLF